MLNMFYIVSERHDDRIFSLDSTTTDSRLQSNRTQSWYRASQTIAYNATILELMNYKGFGIAMILNAVDMYMKNCFNIQFIKFFCVIEKDVIEQISELKSMKLPLIVLGMGGTRIYYNKCLSRPSKITECIYNWFDILKRDHKNVLFKNIEIVSI